MKPSSGPMICTIPCRRSVIPKYVTPNAFTFSSRVVHCARESGWETKSLTVVKFLREAVLRLGAQHRYAEEAVEVTLTEYYDLRSREYSLYGEQGDRHCG